MAKLPNVLIRNSRVNRGKVVSIDTANEPTTTRETRQIGRALKETSQVTLILAALCSTVKGRNGSSTVQHSTVATARHSDTNVGQACRRGRGAAQVLVTVKVLDTGSLQEVLDLGNSLGTAAGQPLLLLRAEACDGANLGACAGA